MRVTLAGGAKFRDLARDIRRAKGTLRRDVAQALRAATTPLVKELQQATLHADLHGFPGSGPDRFTGHVASKGVRRPMSRAISGDVSTSAADPRARVILDVAKVPPRIRALVPYFAGKHRLRHPLMGNRSAWFAQHAPNVWWPIINRHERDYVRKVDDALDKARQRMEGQH